MARDFWQVVESIKEVAPRELVDELNRNCGFWAPELAWYKLTEYVHRYVPRSSKSAKSSVSFFLEIYLYPYTANRTVVANIKDLFIELFLVFL